MLRDLQAYLGLKDHLDRREPVGTQVLREIMGPSVLQEHQDQWAHLGLQGNRASDTQDLRGMLEHRAHLAIP